MSLRPLVIAAAAAAAFGAATPAAAGSFASASLGPFGYTLFDLNPGDGIPASVAFSLGGSPYGSYVQSGATDPSTGAESSSGWSLVAFGTTAVSSAIGLGSAQALVSGSPTGGGLLYAASGAALGSTLPAYPTMFNASAAVANFGSLGFTLSPYTLIVFSGSASLMAQTTQGATLGNGLQTESASASVSLSVGGPTSAGGQGSQNASDNRSLFASFNSVFDPGSGQFAYTGQTLSLAGVAISAGFTNFTADALSGQLSVNVSVNGSSPLAPIPEPASAALWLAGLAGLGLWARRRR